MPNKIDGKRVAHGHKGALGKASRCHDCKHPRHRRVVHNKPSCYCFCHAEPKKKP